MRKILTFLAALGLSLSAAAQQTVSPAIIRAGVLGGFVTSADCTFLAASGTVTLNAGTTGTCVNSSGAPTNSTSGYAYIQMAANITLAYSGTPTVGSMLLVEFQQSGGGGWTVTAGTGFSFPSTLCFNTANNSITFVAFVYDRNNTWQPMGGAGGLQAANSLSEVGGVCGGSTVTAWFNIVGSQTANGVLYGGGTSKPGVTAAMTNGQLLVGQTSAAPLPKTVSNDMTMAASGAATVVGLNSTNLAGLATGLLKNTTGTGVPAIAASGTDYAPATSGTSILKGNSSGGFSNAAAGTDYVAPTGSGAGLTGITLTQTTGCSGSSGTGFLCNFSYAGQTITTNASFTAITGTSITPQQNVTYHVSGYVYGSCSVSGNGMQLEIASPAAGSSGSIGFIGNQASGSALTVSRAALGSASSNMWTNGGTAQVFFEGDVLVGNNTVSAVSLASQIQTASDNCTISGVSIAWVPGY